MPTGIETFTNYDDTDIYLLKVNECLSPRTAHEAWHLTIIMNRMRKYNHVLRIQPTQETKDLLYNNPHGQPFANITIPTAPRTNQQTRNQHIWISILR